MPRAAKCCAGAWAWGLPVSAAGDRLPARGHGAAKERSAGKDASFKAWRFASMAVAANAPCWPSQTRRGQGLKGEISPTDSDGISMGQSLDGSNGGATDAGRLLAMLGWPEGSVYPLWHLLDVRLCWANGGPLGLEPVRALDVGELTLRMLIGSVADAAVSCRFARIARLAATARVKRTAAAMTGQSPPESLPSTLPMRDPLTRNQH